MPAAPLHDTTPFPEATACHPHPLTPRSNNLQEEGLQAIAGLENSFKEFDRVLESGDKQAVPIRQQDALGYVGQIEEAMVKEFPYQVPSEYDYLPQLKVRATSCPFIERAAARAPCICHFPVLRRANSKQLCKASTCRRPPISPQHLRLTGNASQQTWAGQQRLLSHFTMHGTT